MAKCQCGAIWLWDWNRLRFVNENGKEYDGFEIIYDLEDCMDVWKCTCGKVNGGYDFGGNRIFDAFDLEESDYEEGSQNTYNNGEEKNGSKTC